MDSNARTLIKLFNFIASICRLNSQQQLNHPITRQIVSTYNSDQNLIQ